MNEDGKADEGQPSLCRAGSGPFVMAQHHPGYTTQEYQYMFYTLARNQSLTFFRANESGTGGSGELRPQPGALNNLTLADVKAEMKAHGVWRDDRDYQVTVAWRDRADRQDFDAFCHVVLQEFYDSQARYDDLSVADCDAFTFRVDTARGVHESYSYCREGPQGVREAFDVMAEDGHLRFAAGL